MSTGTGLTWMGERGRFLDGGVSGSLCPWGRGREGNTQVWTGRRWRICSEREHSGAASGGHHTGVSGWGGGGPLVPWEHLTCRA